ncbi:hypothetical protein C8J57DRAFT_1720645 [Mycena rebaudengoi]|nr:hypothetical protein C8J57DRAFT_1720645 [Mycena rebaudengoi]
MFTTGITLTRHNAADALDDARTLRAAYKKAAKAKKVTIAGGNESYLEDIEEHIKQCEAVLAASGITVDPNAPIPQGSPNDPPPRVVTAADPAVPPQNTGMAVSTVNRDGEKNGLVIDSALLQPPSKRARTEGQDEPASFTPQEYLESLTQLIIDDMRAKPLLAFITAWNLHGAALISNSLDPKGPEVGALADNAAEILDGVLDTVKDVNTAPNEIPWDIEYNGAIYIETIVSLQKWLTKVGLCQAPVPDAPVASKSKGRKKNAGEEKLKIMHEGKSLELNTDMRSAAREDPEMYPGIVEGGLEIVRAAFVNRSNLIKCYSCSVAGPRGQAMDRRPAPTSGEYLRTCKCPLRGAALELWLTKITAKDPSIPQLTHDGMRSDLYLNPNVLKFIAGGIAAASGHKVETLLQPEVSRLKHTVFWALKRLHQIALDEDSAVARKLEAVGQGFAQAMDLAQNNSS